LEQMGRACSDQMRKTKMKVSIANGHLFDLASPTWDHGGGRQGAE